MNKEPTKRPVVSIGNALVIVCWGFVAVLLAKFLFDGTWREALAVGAATSIGYFFFLLVNDRMTRRAALRMTGLMTVAATLLTSIQIVSMLKVDESRARVAECLAGPEILRPTCRTAQWIVSMADSPLEWLVVVAWLLVILLITLLAYAKPDVTSKSNENA